METERVVRMGAILSGVGGVLWAIGPLPGIVFNIRYVNAFVLLPIFCLAAGLLALQDHQHTDHGLIGMVGVVISLSALGLAAIGASISALFPPFQQAEFGLNGNLLFLAGFYLLLVGAVVLGIALILSETIASEPGYILVLTLPIALIGFTIFNRLGVDQYNWVPFTIPYGIAWLVLAYELWENGAPSEFEMPGPGD